MWRRHLQQDPETRASTVSFAQPLVTKEHIIEPAVTESVTDSPLVSEPESVDLEST